MTTFRFQTQVSGSGVITLPPEYYNRKVMVIVEEEQEDGTGKKYGINQSLDDGWRPDPTAVRKLIENRTFTVDISDEEVERIRYERLQRIVAGQAKIENQTSEEWQVAVNDFLTSWKGCLKDVPHMTAKEIRAERLEKKYGQHGHGGKE